MPWWLARSRPLLDLGLLIVLAGTCLGRVSHRLAVP